MRAVLSKIVTERPDGKGGMAPCDTWDNATLLCEVRHGEGYAFPLTAKMQRIAPGETNTWYLSILGTRYGARFTTKQPRTLRTLKYEVGGPQAWQAEDLGYESAFKAITGGIFEFGFTDAMQQMCAAFFEQVALGPQAELPFGCATLDETRATHEIFTAALRVAANGAGGRGAITRRKGGIAWPEGRARSGLTWGTTVLKAAAFDAVSGKALGGGVAAAESSGPPRWAARAGPPEAGRGARGPAWRSCAANSGARWRARERYRPGRPGRQLGHRRPRNGQAALDHDPLERRPGLPLHAEAVGREAGGILAKLLLARRPGRGARPHPLDARAHARS